MSREGCAVRALGGCVAAIMAAIVVGLLLLGLVGALRMLAEGLAALAYVALGGARL